jgi:hypothetical protein
MGDDFRAPLPIPRLSTMRGERARGGLPDPGFYALPGLEQAQAIQRGLVPRPPLAHLTGLTVTQVGPGTAVLRIPASPWLDHGSGLLDVHVLAEAALSMAAHRRTARHGRPHRGSLGHPFPARHPRCEHAHHPRSDRPERGHVHLRGGGCGGRLGPGGRKLHRRCSRATTRATTPRHRAARHRSRGTRLPHTRSLPAPLARRCGTAAATTLGTVRRLHPGESIGHR